MLPADPSIILVDGFVPEIALRIVRKAKERGIPIVFDGGSWKASTSELLPFVDYAIVSERFRPPGVNEPDVIDAIHDFGPKAVAVTRGGQSIFWSLGDARGTIELTSIVAVDTLGAGDIFHGAFCYRFEGDFVKSLEFAAKVSAESCRYVGTREWISHWTNSVS
ncbi:hypothetical protein AUC68_05275 [Methyloceanibacter methanicus]|uniref:Carbohydrate kinase PfkB domain-containing protein n=1 Tax=Methyloceanibacter methanicus TaxID=1774968 RepID=A0A1E3W0P8_9HYPH|nr:hypothetical protein AUC68_05275 [Methyloceanibacter methanicus]